MKTALLADAPGTGQMFSKALAAHFQTRRCVTLKEAATALSQKLDVILCEVSFDIYHSIELLKLARENAMNGATPFILVNAKDNPAFLVKADIQSGKNLGARGFIEAHEWRRKLGDEAAAERLQMYVDGLMVFANDKFWAIGEMKDSYHYFRA